jgi:hypothetical protein
VVVDGRQRIGDGGVFHTTIIASAPNDNIGAARREK